MTFDEMMEELRKENPEFWEKIEREAKEVDIFEDLTALEKFWCNVKAWAIIFSHRIKMFGKGE